MRKIISIIYILFSLNATGQTALQQSIDELGQQYTSQKDNFSLIIGYVSNGVDHISAYGESEKGNETKPTAQSIFGIGEISTVFTTALMANLESNGQLNLNDPIQNYYPGQVQIPMYEKIICKPIIDDPVSGNEHYPISEAGHSPPIYHCYADATYHPSQITICDLATNVSGLPTYPRNLHHSLRANDPFRDYSLTDLYSFLNKYYMAGPTELEYKFSPLGISVLGNGIAWRFGCSYDSLLRIYLTGPLSLNHTSVFYQSPLIPGHDRNGNKISPWNYNALTPALGLYSDMSDMIEFLKLNLDISNSSIRNAISNTHNAKVPITNDKELNESYGTMGWIMSPLFENSMTTIIWQHGNSGGYSSFIGFCKATKTGVVILSNSASTVDEMGTMILQLLNENTTTLAK